MIASHFVSRFLVELVPLVLDIRFVDFGFPVLGPGLYRWEFDKGKESLSVAVNGPLIVDDVETLVRAAIDGVGLAFVSDERVEPQLKSGELIRVLEDWCQPFPGFFLYYPSRRQQPAALAALINTLFVNAYRNMREFFALS